MLMNIVAKKLDYRRLNVPRLYFECEKAQRSIFF